MFYSLCFEPNSYHIIFLCFRKTHRSETKMSKDKRNTVVNHNYSLRKYSENGYKTFNEFYPYYLGEHCNLTNRRLHLIGTSFAVLLASIAILSGYYVLILGALVQGYFFAWLGHYCFEKNRPATFKHPFYSVSKIIFFLFLIQMNKLSYCVEIVYGRFSIVV